MGGYLTQRRGIWGICVRGEAACAGSTEYRPQRHAADVIRHCVVRQLCGRGYAVLSADTGAFWLRTGACSVTAFPCCTDKINYTDQARRIYGETRFAPKGQSARIRG